MNRPRIQRLLTVAGICLVQLPSTAHAYNSGTHFRVANLAWQAMRVASDGHLREHVPWDVRPADASFVYPDEHGSCEIGAARCAELTEGSYGAFVRELGKSRRRLNLLAPAVPDATVPPPLRDLLRGLGIPSPEGPCHSSPAATRVDAFDWKIDGSYHGSIDVGSTVKALPSCSMQEMLLGGIYRTGPHRTLGLLLPDDGRAQQGRVWGYHAQQPDNLWGDTVFKQAPLYGPVVGLHAKGIDALTTALVVALSCAASVAASFVSAFVGAGDIEGCITRGLAAAESMSLDGFLKEVIPGWDGEPSADLVGVWHFIRPNDAGQFNDAPGLNYAHSGPGDAGPGSLDTAIRYASEILWLRLNTETSDGDDHYFIRTSEDGQRPSASRGDYYDRNLVADVEFEPLDNLAQYGWERFRSSAAAGEWSADGLAFPLHAVGDASVPMHAAGSTAWGHRPYEDWVDSHLSNLIFESCRDGDPASPHACGDTFLEQQLRQARRILQWGHFFHEKTRNDEGVRPLVTRVARETLALVGDRADAWPFCDACSTAYMLNDPEEDFFRKAGVSLVDLALPSKSEASGRYGEHAPRIQELVEMSVGATIALLIKASQGRCDDLGDGCASGAECCTGSCESGACCRARGDRCSASSECCAGKACNDDGVCCEKASGAACTADGDCCTGRCNAGSCCKAPLGGRCQSTADCCEGSCTEGICCNTPAGGACGSHAQCCTGGGCGSSGTCCSAALGTPCNGGEVCCVGTCGAHGSCCVENGTACTRSEECCTGRCENPDRKGMRCGSSPR